MGRIIVLNGTSSAGKSTLAATLQRRFVERGEPWIVIGVDDVFQKLPPEWIQMREWFGRYAEDGIVFERVDGDVVRRIGPIGTQALAAYRASVGGAARAGLNVIVDEVLLSEEDWDGWRVELAGLDVLWVRVDIALAALEAREHARRDRMLGLARSQYDIVHRFPDYAVTVDTGVLSAEEAAAVILAAL
jgi:chloramphenicol 3-O phosphotransferase